MSQPSDQGPQRIRIVLLDDHILLREALARLISSEPEFELVGECSTSLDTLKVVKQSPVDVVLVDLRIAKEFIHSAQNAHFGGKCLVVAREVDAADSAIVLKLGAFGIFLESDSTARLLQAIRLVAKGESWVDQKVIRLLADRYPDNEGRLSRVLTEREQVVLNGVVDGLSNRKIGDQIGVSESSIKATLQQLFTKTGVRSRSRLVRVALEGAHSNRNEPGFEVDAAVGEH